MEDLSKENANRKTTDSYNRYVFPTIGLVITIVTLLFGNGIIQTFRQPRIFTSTGQLSFDNKILNSCYVQNDGQSIAENVIVQLSSDESNPFVSDLEIYGAEGQWSVVAGKTGDNYARIELIRLAPSHVLTATVATALPTVINCRVSYQGGSVLPVKSPFSLSTLDYLVLILINVFTVLVMGYLFRRILSKNIN